MSSLPPLLKSKFFWSFSLVTGSVSSAVSYDRYEAHRLKQSLMAEARRYGQEPLPLSSQPRCLAFFLLSPSSPDHRATLNLLRSHALDLLTAAGVDYRWVVEVDGEEAKTKWDEGAREQNVPELMREQQGIPVDELKSNILVPVLHSYLNPASDPAKPDTQEKQLWHSLCAIFTQNPTTWPNGTDGFVAFDPFTAESLKAILNLNGPREVLKPSESIKAKSWWSRASRSSPTPLSLPPPPPPSPLSIPLYNFPCTLPQSPFSRLQRFLFGQRELTRSIGETVMQCIRDGK